MVANRDGSSCDFGRCKACYDNSGQHAPASKRRRRDDATTIILAKELNRLGQPLATCEEFLACWMSHPTLVDTFHPSGAVEVVCATDTKQFYTRGGRWTFDATNKVYVIESVLGVGEQAVAQRHSLQEDEAVILRVCERGEPIHHT